MIRNVVKATAVGKLDLPFDSATLVVDFLEDRLRGFETKMNRFTENGVTQEFCNNRLSKCELPFYFDKEHMTNVEDGNSPSVDIAVISHADSECFFHIEAKRINQVDKKREKEYLVGKKGAIERYKTGKHGTEIRQGKTIFLSHNAIIGYLVDTMDPFEHFQSLINQWIEELYTNSSDGTIWNESDKLTCSSFSNSHKIQKYSSNSLRIERQPLCLHHLWVRLSFQSKLKS